MNAINQIQSAKKSLFDDWTYARPYLLPSLKRLDGLYEEEDIIAAVLAGHMKLWIGVKCAAVTNFIIYPRVKVLNTVIAGAETGYLDNLFALQAEYEGYGLAHGCAKIRVTGRKGWEKILPDFRFESISLVRDI